MKTLKSYVSGQWHEASGGFVPLVNPSTEEEVARVSSVGIDFAAALEHARAVGGPALRELGFAERAALVKEMSKALREHRDELLELSAINNGTTAGDGSFDIDGGSGSLAYYAALGRGLGAGSVLPEGDGVQLARTEGFWAQHVLVPRHGVAVHISAFNFPVWGMAEKAACALLAGMPIITKPATATALTAERAVEILIERSILPEGALQLITGGTGDLLDRLGPQDVVAFTGSADTALKLRQLPGMLLANARFNVEADSLNAAVLAPGVGDGPTLDLFVRDVVREVTQKSGQKCTAVRRILVPSDEVAAIEERLIAKLGRVVTGNPADESVTMGPLATAAQLDAALGGIGELAAEAEVIHGTGERADGVGSPAGKGYFVAPTLLRAAADAERVHELEVFAPVATVIGYDGRPDAAADLVARGGGTLVTSVYGDDEDWLGRFLSAAGNSTGRLYVGSAGSAEAAFGSGAALPQTLHGGPGRAGGGEELGGLVGVKLYMQRLALQGSRDVVEGLAGLAQADAEDAEG